ncbi:MAPEG family protein [Parasulfitobacter algicola]|uniref:MAPEG family protein n=1 Tax=Parasulfitobacter algicola TaxID=2614809 RepID=A0ABX2IRA3_9RHOB|nr:MAPEG family protein [Sulfitobacter algicola]NSX55050.1 MAPEG family protein [Sulfitobacter algicola]
MTPELTTLTLAALLQVIQFILMAIPANLELGTAKTLSPRDPGRLDKPLMDQMSPRTSRLYRALNNHFEALILFSIAVMVITVTDQSTFVTQWAAYLYLLARVLYVPAYAFGWVPWRSLIWFVGMASTVVILAAALI